MPKAAHRRLLLAAKDKGLTGDRKDAYVYGTLQRIEKGQANAAKATPKPKRRS